MTRRTRSCASIAITWPQPDIRFAHSIVCTPILAPQSIAMSVAEILPPQCQQGQRGVDLRGVVSSVL